jgi:hypothetical protein
MVILHWSFLQANVAMTINRDTHVPMPLELNFQNFAILQFHPMKAMPNFQPCSLTIIDAWLMIVGI